MAEFTALILSEGRILRLIPALQYASAVISADALRCSASGLDFTELRDYADALYDLHVHLNAVHSADSSSI